MLEERVLDHSIRDGTPENLGRQRKQALRVLDEQRDATHLEHSDSPHELERRFGTVSGI